MLWNPIEIAFYSLVQSGYAVELHSAVARATKQNSKQGSHV